MRAWLGACVLPASCVPCTLYARAVQAGSQAAQQCTNTALVCLSSPAVPTDGMPARLPTSAPALLPLRGNAFVAWTSLFLRGVPSSCSAGVRPHLHQASLPLTSHPAPASALALVPDPAGRASCAWCWTWITPCSTRPPLARWGRAPWATCWRAALPLRPPTCRQGGACCSETTRSRCGGDVELVQQLGAWGRGQ